MPRSFAAPRAVSTRWLILPVTAGLIVAGVLLVLLGRATARVDRPSRSQSSPPAAAASPGLPPLAAYQNQVYPYELGYPHGWSVAAGNPESVRIDGPDGRQMQVDVQPVPSGMAARGLAAFADERTQSARSTLPNLVELQRILLTLANKQPAVEVDLTWSDGANRRRALLLFALDGDVGYIVRAEVPISVFPKERPLLDRSLRSFSLTPSD